MLQRTSVAVLILVPGLVIISAAAAAEPAGKPTYDRLCASCHGADGKGDADMAKALKIDLELLNLGRPEVANASRESLKSSVLDGKGKMPGNAKKIDTAEVDPLIDYVIQLSKAIRAAAAKVVKPVDRANPGTVDRPGPIGPKPVTRPAAR